MVIYNVTTHVEPSVQEDWLLWMRQELIPQLLSTSGLKEIKIFKVVAGQDQGGVSYAVQRFFESKEKLNHFLKELGPTTRKKSEERYGNRILHFETELHLMEEYS